MERIYAEVRAEYMCPVMETDLMEVEKDAFESSYILEHSLWEGSMSN